MVRGLMVSNKPFKQEIKKKTKTNYGDYSSGQNLNVIKMDNLII